MAELLAGRMQGSILFKLGCLLAACVLTCPTTIAIWIGWLAFVAVRIGLRRAAMAISVVCVVALVPISLWTVRNYAQFGHLFFMRDDAGMALVSSNDDCAGPLLSANLRSGCFASQHPSGSVMMFNKMRSQGEYQFSAAEMQRCRKWVMSHWGRFWELTLARAVLFWFPMDRADRMSTLYGLFFSVLTVLSLFSIRLRCDGFILVTIPLITYPLMYYMAQFEQRYRYPILWITFLLACVGARITRQPELSPSFRDQKGRSAPSR